MYTGERHPRSSCRILLHRSFRSAHRPERRELWLGRTPLLPQTAADASHLRQGDLIVHPLAPVWRIRPLGRVGTGKRPCGAVPNGSVRDRHGDAYPVRHASAERPYRQGSLFAAGRMRV